MYLESYGLQIMYLESYGLQIMYLESYGLQIMYLESYGLQISLPSVSVFTYFVMEFRFKNCLLLKSFGQNSASAIHVSHAKVWFVRLTPTCPS